MRKSSFWMHGIWIPIVAGLAWIGSASDSGWIAYLLSLIPGTLLIASGVVIGLWPGDPSAYHFGALGAALGLLLGLVSFAWAGGLGGLGLIVASAASFVVFGLLALVEADPLEEVPPPPRTAWSTAEVAVDEVVLATMHLSVPMRTFGDARARVRAEAKAALELFTDRGWIEKPADYHAAPPVLERPEIVAARRGSTEYEHLRFESDYEPHPDEPGRERWLGYGACRTAHAWVFRHHAPDRPWLIAIHGYQMGYPAFDFVAFRPGFLHHRLGMNLVMPVLPLHGPRRMHRVSGDGFFSGEVLDTVHAEAQAIWDVRRLVSWVRAQSDAPIGVFGLSLGGYNTALTASLVDGLACAVAGIPVVDVVRLYWEHGPRFELAELEREGPGRETMERLLRVISPLALTPRVPAERRYLFGATGDQLVPADQVRDLWRHWERPRIVWYPGGHMTFLLHRPVRQLLSDAFRESGLAL